jgi:carboxyl-terminal processing protease
MSCDKIGGGCELAIIKPITGSPAAAAGIQPGDVISTVAGTSLDGLTTDQAIALIKGPKGTTVTLGIVRGSQTIQVPIVRNVYTQPEVETRTLGNGTVAYMHVTGMNQPASSQFDAALATALAAGQKNVILDLRGNLGGYQVDGAGKTSELDANSGGRATDPAVHLVVLVDGNTASAAEILSGALQARGRAKLIGTKTYGKGVVQEWLPLPDNFGGIHLTVARWLTPDHVWIQGKGLLPDIPVDSSNARAGTDPVLDAALAQFGLPPEPSASPSPSAVPSTGPSTGPSAVPSTGPSTGPAAS